MAGADSDRIKPSAVSSRLAPKRNSSGCVLARLESIGQLQYQPVFFVRVVAVAVKEFVIAFEKQRVREVINVPDSFAAFIGAQAVMTQVVAADQFEVIDDRPGDKIQPGEFITGLDPPALGIDVAGVAAVPG